MTDADVEKLLKKALLAETAPEPTEEVIDAYLRCYAEPDRELVDRIKRRFVEKLFIENFPEPVRVISNEMTLGDYLETQRSAIGLGPADIGRAVGTPTETIVSIEKGRTEPWMLKLSLMADLMLLFRIHFELFKRLIETTSSVGQMGNTGPVLARSKDGRMSEERGDSVARAMERFKVRRAAKKPTSEASDWLAKLDDYIRANADYEEFL